MQENEKIPFDFYQQTDVVALAQALLGKVLVTCFEGLRTSGRITETEAYRAPDDLASHARGNRRTPRTRVMFEPGGRAYIYLCYGIHHLFNVVTGPEGSAHAVLIRSIEPLEGISAMATRRFGEHAERRLNKGGPALLGVGPGVLTQSLGLKTNLTGHDFFAPSASIWVENDRHFVLAESQIAAGPRIGVDYAGVCAAWEWRFWIKDSPYVS